MTFPGRGRRDVDAIRAAFGVSKITLRLSYGTYIGQVYETLFPDQVRRMVLDSVSIQPGSGMPTNVARISVPGAA